MVAICNTTFNV